MGRGPTTYGGATYIFFPASMEFFGGGQREIIHAWGCSLHGHSRKGLLETLNAWQCNAWLWNLCNSIAVQLCTVCVCPVYFAHCKCWTIVALSIACINYVMKYVSWPSKSILARLSVNIQALHVSEDVEGFLHWSVKWLQFEAKNNTYKQQNALWYRG